MKGQAGADYDASVGFSAPVDNVSGGVRMVTEDEIRARVQAADLSRSQARAEAAAKIAAYVIRRRTARAELAEIESAISAAVADAADIMTVAELSEFIGVAQSELLPLDTASDVLPRRQARRKAAGARRIRPAAAPSDSPVARSSDF